MRGCKVIFKFLMISFRTTLESWFSWDPLHCFPYSSSPTLWIPYVFSINGKVFLSCIWVWQFHGAQTIFHGTHQHLPEYSHQHILSISLSIIPTWTSPPSTLQVLHQFLTDFGSDFEVESQGLLVGF